jgi:hypothetical protein
MAMALIFFNVDGIFTVVYSLNRSGNPKSRKSCICKYCTIAVILNMNMLPN